MKNGDLIISENLKSGIENEIDLKLLYPLGKIECQYLKRVYYKVDDSWKETASLDNFHNVTARYIKVEVEKDCELKLYVGLGYVAVSDKDWTSLLTRKDGWAGGDGIFSFNLTNGNDSFNQKDISTLFVFGDTLIGKIDKKTNRRLYPIMMPSNTVAYLNGIEPIEKNVDFKINTNELDTIIPFYSPNNESMYDGTLPSHLCKYTTDKALTPWISGYSPKKVELIFDLYTTFNVDFIDFYNYFLEEQQGYNLENRGLNEINISASIDLITWTDLGKQKIALAKDITDYTRIEIGKDYQYFKVSVTPKNGIGNHYKDEDEVVFGLNKVKFYSNGKLLTDVKVTASSLMNKSQVKSWFWLQDGVVIGNNLYFLPILIVTDMSKPVGLEFAVRGTSFIKTPIENGKLNFEKQTQKDTPLCVTKNGTDWLFGCAIMANTTQAGALNPDEYIYVYGYSTNPKGQRHLHVARVKSDDFEYISKWEYFSENGWVNELTESMAILSNLSCEMSVTPITSGENIGKYLAVFQHNVNSLYVAYSIGETPCGPFSEPNLVYKCPDKEILGGSSYTYNAKAHPHLSTSDNILVSYNSNAYGMDDNEANSDVYHPRFIRLRDTSNVK